MEAPAVSVILLMSFTGKKTQAVPLLFLALWEIHYLYRTFIYPFLMREAKKQFPFSLVLLAMVFNSANGYVNGWNLFFSDRLYEQNWLTDPRFLVGAALFLSGLYIHFQSDRTLRNLREPGDASYKIPAGGLYRFVSSPNYLGEIIQWTGWALATWSLAGLSFACFTVANLLPRALSHHKWYRMEFSDYPGKRKAVIPFLL